jgi:hypothetical protein
LYHLSARQIKEAIQFASNYKNLVFFAHALEILLHTVVESESTVSSSGRGEGTSVSPDVILPTVVEFLDHFDVSLDVVVGCARKTELTRWRRLFDVVGNPKALFEVSFPTFDREASDEFARPVSPRNGSKRQGLTYWFSTTLSSWTKIVVKSFDC